MRYSFFLFITIVLLFSNCKKDTKVYTISGNVSNKQTSNNINGVKVSLDAKMIKDGVYNPSFVNLEDAYTDDNGNYSMEINEAQVSDYRFRISKDTYFDYEEIVKVDDLQSSTNFTKNFTMIAESWIELKVKNITPHDNNDKIVYRFTNIDVTGNQCCSNQAITGIGAEYNESNTCRVQSNDWIYLKWTVIKNGGQHVFEDSLFTEPGQTTIYALNY
ncbi:MAG: hypothetical protein DRI86_10270 [Bacteroidetes bacterium]|nr:MAG: hypothetical protein DRI86_10270 [Bacteroidota bacterium]